MSDGQSEVCEANPFKSNLEARVAWLESALQRLLAANVKSAPWHELRENPINLNDYSAYVHQANWQWWHDIETGERIERNKGEQLCLIHSEISECLEGVRKGLMDDHLPHRTMEAVELADALIRIFDYAGGHRIDLHGAFEDKMDYNAQRADHKAEHRKQAGGKKF